MTELIVNSFNSILLDLISEFGNVHPESGIGKYYYIVKLDSSDRWLREFHNNIDYDHIVQRNSSIFETGLIEYLGLGSYTNHKKTMKSVWKYIDVLSKLSKVYCSP